MSFMRSWRQPLMNDNVIHSLPKGQKRIARKTEKFIASKCDPNQYLKDFSF